MKDNLENKDILIISNEPWGDLWYSKHHYANELSKNNRVFFLNPPSKWKIRNLAFSYPQITRNGSNLFVVSYANFLPLTGISNILYFINDKFICRKLERLFHKYNVHNPIFWTFDPYRLLNPAYFNPLISIYQSMDMYNWKREKWLADKVDIILTVSKKIANKFNTIKAPVFIIPHGVTESVYSAEEISVTKTENIILLAGTISSRVDFGLLYKIAGKFTDHTLQIIGPVMKNDLTNEDLLVFEKLKRLPNVNFQGILPFHELSKNIIKCKLAICTYKQNSVGNQLNSLKIKQYLTYGKNTVSTYLEELKEVADRELIDMSNEHDIFLDLCKTALLHKPSLERIKDRIHYTKDFLYPNLLQKIESIIQNYSHEDKEHF